MKGRGSIRAAVLCSVLVAFAWPGVRAANGAGESSSASFYKDKTIRLVVGYSPGGGFDTFGRLMARYLGEFIPGKPKVIVVNMPGAGSLSAANRVYHTRDPDGLTLVTFHYSHIPNFFAGDPLVKFDPLKYRYIGHPSLGGIPRVLFVRNDLNITSLDDLKKRKTPLALADTGANNSSAVAARFLQTIGVPVKSVHGYRGSAQAFAAVERGEMDGRITTQSVVQTVYRRLLDNNVVRPIVSLGKEPRLEAFPGVATVEDLNLNTKQAELADLLIRTWRFIRMYAVPPGTPEDRVTVLRDAFTKALESPELKEQAERQGVIIAPTPWKELEQEVIKLSKTPPEAYAKYREFIGMK